MSNSERRSGLTDNTVKDLVGDADQERRSKHWTRDRSWDAEQTKATYRIPLDLREEVKKTAHGEGLSADELARLFLEHGLKLYYEVKEDGRKVGLEAFGVEKKPKAREFQIYED